MTEGHEMEEQKKYGIKTDTGSASYHTRHVSSKHLHVAYLLMLYDKSIAQYIFFTVAALCDPFTQPEEDEESCLSLDLLSSILIASTYHRMLRDMSEDLKVPANELEVESVKFNLALKYFDILEHIDRGLCTTDELALRRSKSLPYSLWTPSQDLRDDESSLKLVYSIACVLLMSLYKLFKSEEEPCNLIVNPFLHYFISSWKRYTSIILLGLEVDRKTEILRETNNDDSDSIKETPEFVKWILQGSSAIRHVLAWILNQNPSSVYDEDGVMEKTLKINDYDIKEESLLGFIQPLARKKINGGSLILDMRLVMIGLLILNSGISFTSFHPKNYKKSDLSDEEATRVKKRSKPISELGDILIDLEYDDRFDEDIRYIFELDYQDSEDEWSHSEDDEEAENSDLNSKTLGESKDGDDVFTAVRSEETDIEFDEFGRDWRDLPREDNVEFQPEFLELVKIHDAQKDNPPKTHFFSSWSEVEETLHFLILNSIEDNKEKEEQLGQPLLNTISKAIKDEMEDNDNDITLDKLFIYLSTTASDSIISSSQTHSKLIVPIFNVTKFEVLLHNNNKLARCVIDEMLMCKGYRRVILWFLTHNVNLSTLLIDFVFELSTGLRGNAERCKPYKFTRKGNKLFLSKLEQSMLIHEFLNNSSIYISAADGIEIDDGYTVVLAESVAKKYMELLCLMINQLIKNGIISLEVSEDKDHVDDYSNELKVLLIHWVGKLPAARDLYFRVSNVHSQIAAAGDQAAKIKFDRDAEVNLIEKYSEMSPPLVSADLENNKEHFAVISNFVNRLSADINYVVANQKKEPIKSYPIDHVSQDFKFFMDNFNTLCKIEYLAESLFVRFEDLLSNGLGEDDTFESCDSEFSEPFLNGQGQFGSNASGSSE